MVQLYFIKRILWRKEYTPMKIQESGENYLETILLLHNRNGYVRSIDIANELDYSKPSVSRAMGILKNANLIMVEPGGNIVLTEEGQKRADAIYERHCFISEYLKTTLGISPEIASQDACRIEHIISEETFKKIKQFCKQSSK